MWRRNLIDIKIYLIIRECSRTKNLHTACHNRSEATCRVDLNDQRWHSRHKWKMHTFLKLLDLPLMSFTLRKKPWLSFSTSQIICVFLVLLESPPFHLCVYLAEMRPSVREPDRIVTTFTHLYSWRSAGSVYRLFIFCYRSAFSCVIFLFCWWRQLKRFHCKGEVTLELHFLRFYSWEQKCKLMQKRFTLSFA